LIKEMRDEILSFVEAHADEQVRFVIELCNKNSYTYNKKGADLLADMIIHRLEDALPHHSVTKMEEVGDFHILRNSAEEKSIYLVGHLDTVFPPGHPFQQCRIEGDDLHGPGTCDMKGGLAVIIFAIKALEEAGILSGLKVSLILNSDEEVGSPYSRVLFQEERPRAMACLTAECAGPNGEVVVSRNGKMGGRIDCFGKGLHVGFADKNKSSAILELAHKIIQLESLNGIFPGVTLNAGKIEGGLGPSTVPSEAHCFFDVRWVDEEHRENLLKRIREEISRPSQPGCRTEMEITNWRPAMPLHPGTEKMHRLMKEVAESLGQKLPSEHRRGTSDANFFGKAGIPTLDGLGPVGEKDHTPGEFIKVSTLKGRTALLAVFLAELSKKPV
jgi:glutamate carboxypeptidase